MCWFHHSGFSIANTRQGVCILPEGIFYWDPYSLMFTSFLVALNKTLNPLSSGNILSLIQSLRQPSVLNRCTARRDLNDKYLQKGTNLKTIRGFKESRLWKTANENLYHLIKFSLYLSFTVHYLYKEVSCFLPVLYIRIVLSCFYLLIFYFEKFSSWIWHLLFAVSMTLNLSNNNKIYHRVKSKNHHISQLIHKHTTYLNLSW